MSPKIRPLLVAVLAIVVVTKTLAQDAPQDFAPTTSPGAIQEEQTTVPEQVVQVESGVEDEDIVTRLKLILETTKRFQSLEVNVENGVLFLSGITDRAESRDKATELAVKVEGVTWVVNNIEVHVPEEPLWNFAPAMRELESIGREAVQGLPLLVLGLVILLFTLFATSTASLVFRPLLRRRIDSGMLREVINKVLIVFIGIVGLYFFLRVSGLTNLAVAMLSGTGVIGLLLGFAFRDIAENFLASILISVQRPFNIGDTIEVDGLTGVVQKVTTRGSVLMAFDGNYIQISNSTVYKNTIRNFTANPSLRLDFLVGIGYDASISQAQAIILKVLEDHDAVLTETEPLVLVETLGGSTVNLRVYFWINCHTHSALKVKSAVMRLSLGALLEAGISLPDDAREVVFPDGVPLIQMDEKSHAAQKTKIHDESMVAAKKEQESAATAAEGDLRSEVDELNRQAAAAGVPEKGKDLLSDTPVAKE